MTADNLFWLETLMVSSLFSFIGTLASVSVLAQPKPHHFFKLFHESIVRQQQVYPAFFFTVGAARMQDESIESYRRNPGDTAAPDDFTLRDAPRVFPYSVAMFTISLTMAIAMAAGPWAVRPLCLQ